MEHVFGGDGLGADAGLREGDIFGDVAREVMTYHKHIKMLVQGIPSIGASGIGRRREDIIMFHHADDIWSVATSGTLCMVGVDRAALEGADGLLDESGFIERIGVDEGLDIIFIANGQAGVDGSWRGTPIFVELETADSGFGLLLEWTFVSIVTLASDSIIQGEFVNGLQHLADMSFSRCAGGGIGTGTTNH